VKFGEQWKRGHENREKKHQLHRCGKSMEKYLKPQKHLKYQFDAFNFTPHPTIQRSMALHKL